MAEVPRLDLAPKRKRPLSLWNSLDYLLLLYWVFYFPQAIRWYVETFCGAEPKLKPETWQEFWQLVQNSPRKVQLASAGLILTLTTTVLLCFGFEQLGFRVDWSSVTIGVAVGVAGGVTFGVAFDVAVGVVVGVAVGIMVGVAGGVAGGVARIAAGGVTIVVAVGVTVGVEFGVARFVAGFVAGGVAVGVASGVASGVVFGVVFGVAVGVAVSVMVGVAVLRPDNRWPIRGSIPRITPLPLSKLSRRVSTWLQEDWEGGLNNANQLLRYSLQFMAVDKGVNRVLDSISENILIHHVATLADRIWDWQILQYSSASLSAALKVEFIENIFWLPNKRWFEERWGASRALRFDTPTRAAAAGFWYWHELELDNAVQAFSKLQDKTFLNQMEVAETSRSERPFAPTITLAERKIWDIPYGQEVYQLACIFRDWSLAIDARTLLTLSITKFPASPYLRPVTWSALQTLRDALEDAHVALNAASRAARSFALNRALGNIKTVLDTLNTLPPEVSRVERPILEKIARNWQEILLSQAGEIGQVTIEKPVNNPYTIGDPVFGSLFIGREDILRQLEELWVINRNLQSVILFGHRRMGKTSILRNTTPRLGSQVNLAYVNLLSLGGAANGVVDILMAICDAIAEATQIPPPSNHDLQQYPENTFRRHLKQVEQTLAGKGLIIALDEFEKIEDLINTQKISPDFLEFLRGMVQASPNIAFAFAGLHALEEMTADYFQPFFASFIPIRVAFLSPDATHQVLANPNPEFLLEYEPATLDRIYQLTHGQPYLTQLIGFQLVRLYNDFVFEQGHPRHPIFTPADVEVICENQQFFTTGSNYFNGVWNQANEGAPGQQTILRALAANPQGLTIIDLAQHATLTPAQIDAALETLQRHDVVHKTPGQSEASTWQITVELFRIWVEREKQNGIR